MVKMIKPRPIRRQDITKAVDLGLKAADAEVEAGYKLTYWNWEEQNQPEWKIVGPRTERGNRVLRRETTDTPYVFVDLGTPGPYPITAKNAPTLKFQTGFIPKTAPGRLTSQVGARFGPWASPIEVTHPGIKKRGFSEKLAEDAEESLPKHMDHYLGGV